MTLSALEISLKKKKKSPLICLGEVKIKSQPYEILIKTTGRHFEAIVSVSRRAAQCVNKSRRRCTHTLPNTRTYTCASCPYMQDAPGMRWRRREFTSGGTGGMHGGAKDHSRLPVPSRTEHPLPSKT